MNQQQMRKAFTLIGACTLVGFFVLIATATMSAQGKPSGIPQVLEALAILQSTVEQLFPGDPETVRFTPAALAETGEVINCRVVNVTEAALTVRTDVRGQFTSNGLTFSVPSGDIQIAARGVRDEFVTAGTRLNAYCRFTVVNGAAADIRASLAIHTNLGSEKISLPAE